MSETEVIQSDTGSQPEAVSAEPAPVAFIDTLNEELRTEPSLRNFTDASGLAKSYIHAQKMIGMDKIAVPGKSSTDEEWNHVYQKLGRPNAAGDYGIKDLEGFSEDDISNFQQIAHDAGLNAKQAEKIAKAYSEKNKEAIAASVSEREEILAETKTELEKEFGKAFEQKMKMAKSAAVRLGAGEIIDEIELSDGTLLGDHPAIIRMFVGLANQMGEDTLEGETTDLIMTPDEARRELNQIIAKDTPYWDKTHPEHDYYTQKALELREHIHVG
jgi:hypothetical protein